MWLLELSTKEIWKALEETDDYLVSNFGRVMSLKGGKERILKTHINRDGYEQLGLSIHGKRYVRTVHRLVANAFIPNNDGKPQVNHVDGNKENNVVHNLEWVTAKENIAHAYILGLRDSETLKNNGLRNSKKVSQIDVETGSIIKVWESIKQIPRKTGGAFDSAAIHRCCHLVNDTHKGFRWRFKGEESRRYGRKYRSKGDPIEVDFGDYYEVFPNASVLSREMGVARNSVYRAINQGRKLLGKYDIGYA